MHTTGLLTWDFNDSLLASVREARRKMQAEVNSSGRNFILKEWLFLGKRAKGMSFPKLMPGENAQTNEN
jgi:hypothetical protein